MRHIFHLKTCKIYICINISYVRNEYNALMAKQKIEGVWDPAPIVTTNTTRRANATNTTNTTRTQRGGASQVSVLSVFFSVFFFHYVLGKL